jgi:hypothetical protein
MAVRSHLIEHRWLGSVASLIAALIHLDQKRFGFSVPVCHRFVLGMVFGGKKACVLIVLICSSLLWPLVALSQEIDEGEFSRTMLGYKLQLLNNQFEQTETRFLTRSVAGSAAKRLEHVYNEIKCLEVEFRCGKYFPDLLDDQIVVIREELRLILADPVKTTSMSEPGFL